MCRLVIWLNSFTTYILNYFSLSFLSFFLNLLADHPVHRVEQCLLLDTHTLGEFAEVGGAQDLVWYDGDALHDATDGLGALHGIGHIFHRQTGLEGNEVRGILLDIVLKLLSRMFL